MTTQTLSFNPKNFFRCFKKSISQHKSSGIMCFFLGFVFLPLQYILTIMSGYSQERIISNLVGIPNCYTDFSAPMFVMFVVLISAIIPTHILSYMHNKRACDVFHSLPFTRTEMLLGSIASGLTLIIVPIFLNFVILALAASTVPFGMPLACLIESIYWIVAATACFSVVVFVSCQVGTIFDTIIFTVLIDSSLVILQLVRYGLSSMFLYGFNTQDTIFETLYRFSPVSIILGRFIYNENRTEELTINIIWVFVALALLVAATIIYNLRKSEQAESVTDKGPLSVFSRVIGTLSGGLLLGFLFAATLNIESEPVILICIFFGSIITYVIGDLIVTRHIRFEKGVIISSILTSLVVCLISASFMFDIYGFETRIPAIDEIKSVTLTHYDGRFDNQPDYTDYYSPSIDYFSDDMIEAVHEIHQASIEQRNEKHFEEQYFYHSIPSITYNLKSGKTMTRRYDSYYSEDLSSSLLKIETSDEFMQKKHPLFIIDSNSILKITAKNMFGDKETVLKLNNSQMQTLVEALRSDMLNITQNEFWDEQMLGKINLTIPYLETDRHYTEESADGTDGLITNVIVTTSFKNTVAFLEDAGYEDCFDNDLERIKSAYIGMSPYYSSSFVKYSDYDFAYDINYNIFGEDNYRKEKDLYFELTDSDLQILKDSIRAYSPSNKKSAIIAFQCQTDENEPVDTEVKIKGYSFIDLENLPADLAEKISDESNDSTDTWLVD